MTTASIEYAALDDGDKQKYIDLGSLATLAPPNSSWRSSLGPSMREVNRATSKRSYDTQLALLYASRLNELGNTDDHALAVRPSSACAVVDRAFALTTASAPYTERLSVASRQWKMERRLQLDRQRHLAKVLEDWHASAGKKELDDILCQIPGLKDIGGNIVVVPDCDANKTIRVSLNPKLLGDFTAWVASNPHKTNMLKGSDFDWTAKHLPIMHEALCAIMSHNVS